MATPRGASGLWQDEDPAPLTKQEIVNLRAKLSPELQDEEWYTILTAATASTKAGAEAVPLIYEIASEALVHSPTEKEADEKAVRIQRRIKESLLKGSVLFGIPPAIDLALALVNVIRAEAAEHPARKDSGFFQRRGQTLDGVSSRGTDQLRKVYRHNLEGIYEKFGDDMEDLRFLTLDIHYGWTLSEVCVLDFRSTEMIILAALIPQNARAEILRHLRGCRRADWSDECIKSVRDVCGGTRAETRVPDLEGAGPGTRWGVLEPLMYLYSTVVLYSTVTHWDLRLWFGNIQALKLGGILVVLSDKGFNWKPLEK